MIRKLSVSFAALAAMGIAGAASAQTNLWYLDGPPNYGANFQNDNPASSGGVDVEIEVWVQDIAVLSVINDSASMTVDDGSDTFMGVTSQGSSYEAADLAVLQLDTNFDVSSINITYPKVSNIALNNSSGFWYGEAIGKNTGNVLGVWPQAGVLDGPTGSIIGGGGGMIGNDSSNSITPIVRDNVGNTDFGNGSHYIGLGVSTEWRNVLAAAPETFAAPDKYEIALTATIMP